MVWGVWVFGSGYLNPPQNPGDVGRVPSLVGESAGRVVLLLSNLPIRTPDRGWLTPTGLFRLMSQYGNVTCVKVLKKNRSGKAMVQFGGERCAQTARRLLHRTCMGRGGGLITVEWSHHDNCTNWRGGGTELDDLMVHADDFRQGGGVPPPAPKHARCAPSVHVAVSVVPETNREELVRKAEEIKAVRLDHCAELGLGILTFADVQSAARCVACTNGTAGPTGEPLSVYFISDIPPGGMKCWSAQSQWPRGLAGRLQGPPVLVRRRAEETEELDVPAPVHTPGPVPLVQATPAAPQMDPFPSAQLPYTSLGQPASEACAFYCGALYGVPPPLLPPW
eukprot:TRINITY_DN5244_c0_g2_i2.p1 TRINITY_DN5244_c0_g2~~TRINITY_DN5244_c0_g2_i2.p1  ORF type:complete len:336 (+),score=93.56 TRINITY_DN5244_c0_g2_i2:435-1442(+)